MKIFIKNLKQETQTLEVSPSNTISDVKKMIEAEQKHEMSWQKLIYSGKILENNEATLESLNINDGNFIVLMVRKPTTLPAPKAPVVAKTEPQVASPPQPQVVSPPQPQPQPQPQQQPSGDSAQEENITRICEMGFERATVERALARSFNNPDRAVEYLMNGIPDEDEANPGYANAGGDNLLNQLAQHPQLDQIRQAFQQNPRLIQPLIQQLATSNPQLLQFIQEHQEEFVQLMSQGGEGMGDFGDSDDDDDDMGGAVDYGMLGGADGDEDDGEGEFVQVTDEEKEAISRLEALGFDRNLVIQAYFACDKDENAAANYLLENGDF